MKNQYAGGAERAAYDEIARAFNDISGGYNQWIDLDQSNAKAVRFHLKGGPLVGVNECGLGLQDLLVILYFAVATVYTVILIEEPESHMHPAMQKKLLELFKDKTNKQYFLTTHSNVFLNCTLVERVFFTSFKDCVRIDDATQRASILHDLGYSVADNLVSDLVVLVEGPSDVAVLEEFIQKFEELKSYNIKMWHLGGDTMGYADLSVFASYKILALVDRDPGSNKARTRFMANCQAHGIDVTRLKRYAIENYFTVRVLRDVFGKDIQPAFAVIDPGTKLEDQIGFSVKHSNRAIARSMTLAEVKATDDLYSFLEKLERKCKE